MLISRPRAFGKFTVQGKTCCVAEAHLEEKAGEHLAQYVLELGRGTGDGAEDEPAAAAGNEGGQGPGHEFDRRCLLEVVQQVGGFGITHRCGWKVD